MIKMTTQIVAAYVANNPLDTGDLENLIRSTYAALVSTAISVEPAVQVEPAVPIKKSVKSDAIYCLECGKGQKMLKRHLATAHSLSVDQYRANWGLAGDYPMVAPDYAEHRSMLAKKIGLGRSRTKKVSAVSPPVAEKPKRGRLKLKTE